MTTLQIITLIITVFNSLVLLVLGSLNIRQKTNIEWIKTGLEKELIAHSVRFSNEFGIYKYLWEKAAHFTTALKNAYQLDSLPRSSKTDSNAMGFLIGPVLRERYEVTETLLNNAPFISDEVKTKAGLLIELSIPSDFVSESCLNREAFFAEIDKRRDELEKVIMEKTINQAGEK